MVWYVTGGCFLVASVLAYGMTFFEGGENSLPKLSRAKSLDL